eukprot:CAMPEP_0177776376 /NCGR_PEP_ID=MMETSP0491_2-20121128/14678_1 /TAXON_ID=63592 /ORGANISM="Tetraselmis chuii, Strain PLY429" /LENGTH=113 /DNA_ID=CAMNT_0019295159 /DNA_START=369 /DNA_END=711 /DNA_ORIENTATION=+
MCFGHHVLRIQLVGVATHFRGPDPVLSSLSLQEDFEAAAEEVKGFTKVTDADKLILYGLFKQANVGDVEGDRPGMFSPTNRAKWDAWEKNKGMTKEKAMEDYIAKVAQLKADQ